MEIKKISKGVELALHSTNQFKTAVMALSIITPLDSKTSEKALLTYLLSRTNGEYPTMLSMNRVLASLYGASITPVIEKKGEAQILKLVLSALDDRFTLDDEKVCEKCIDLLCSCLFRPDVEENGFKEENMEREKRLLIEKIESEKDEKRIYALNRMIEEMCCNEPYGKSKFGEKDRIEKLMGKEIFDVWKEVLISSPVQISYIGSAPSDEIEKKIKDVFSKYTKENIPEIRTEFLVEAEETKTVTEKQTVKQGKLVIGYRAGMTYDMDNYAAIRLMTAIFGSGTFSKLFMNVREKMSLCYYCSARLISSKGIIVVESGVETENAQKALDAIRHELDEVRKGNFTDETIADAKMSISDTLHSVNDSNLSILSWFSSFCASGSFYTPDEIAEMINNVSREEIILAANMITEDTVFILESEKEEETDE